MAKLSRVERKEYWALDAQGRRKYMVALNKKRTDDRLLREISDRNEEKRERIRKLVEREVDALNEKYEMGLLVNIELYGRETTKGMRLVIINKGHGAVMTVLYTADVLLEKKARVLASGPIGQLRKLCKQGEVFDGTKAKSNGGEQPKPAAEAKPKKATSKTGTAAKKTGGTKAGGTKPARTKTGGTKKGK